jgi:hypothetical protein
MFVVCLGNLYLLLLYYQSHCSTQSGLLIGVSRFAAFVVFYKDFDVTHVHTSGSCVQNGVSLVNM